MPIAWLGRSPRGQTPAPWGCAPATRSTSGQLSVRSGGPGRLAGPQGGVGPVELLADAGDDGVERLGVVDRQLREALAVELDVGQAEAVDQPAVAEPPHLGRRGQPGDEQPAEVALLR